MEGHIEKSRTEGDPYRGNRELASVRPKCLNSSGKVHSQNKSSVILPSIPWNGLEYIQYNTFGGGKENQQFNYINSLPLSAFDAQISGLWSPGRTGDNFLLPHREGNAGRESRTDRLRYFQVSFHLCIYMHKLTIQRSERMEKCFRTQRVLIYSKYKGLLVFFLLFSSSFFPLRLQIKSVFI